MFTYVMSQLQFNMIQIECLKDKAMLKKYTRGSDMVLAYINASYGLSRPVSAIVIR